MPKKPRTEAPIAPTFVLAWRKHRRLTLAELSQKIAFSQTTISQIEQGKQQYSQRFIEAAATALQCRTIDLLAYPPSTGDVPALAETYGAVLRRLIEEMHWFKYHQTQADEKLAAIEGTIAILTKQSEELDGLMRQVANHFDVK